ncbi:Cu+-exporting ATPase [Arcanobacterium pluranimalium]|uniref:heavy metal translocating P-type ATPase n=1 Tax=Arcanobacterium pluranimalium TaxID=108028 RepID=UPI001EF7780F|nr:cation-translocating P-type ATPase [Arcanobacterium pluranimalium]MBM7824357.1 Cu+-exporting ATPase [Arcanobacterium pluranimalium]
MHDTDLPDSAQAHTSEMQPEEQPHAPAHESSRKSPRTQPHVPPHGLPNESTDGSPEELYAEVDLAISGMTCASCVARVEKKLNKLAGVNAVVNLATEKAHVSIAESARSVSDSDLVAVVEKAGYNAQVLQRTLLSELGAQNSAPSSDIAAYEEATQRAHAARIADLRLRMIVSMLLTVPIVALSMITSAQFPAWQWLVFALSVPVAFWGGYPFHRAAFRAARHGSSTMDTLVSLGVIASMGWSIWALILGGAGELGYTMHMSGIHGLMHADQPHLYFESAAMIVSFLLLGRWLEARSRRTARDALHSLLELGAKRVHILRRASGKAVDAVLSIEELQVGDVFLVKPGEKIATDGIVVEGHSGVDASLLTGESVPIEVKEGDAVTGATLNTSGSLTIRATRVGAETTLQQMGRLLTQAQTGKAQIQNLADRISAVFVPSVLVIALLTLLVRVFVFDNPMGMALAAAITVLVVACPCALGLATPTALLVGSGAASQRGILIRGAEILETAHSVDTVVLDKTGTLTTGVMTVTSVQACADVFDERAVLAIAQAVEKHSEHPLAQAIVRYQLPDDVPTTPSGPSVSLQAGTFLAHAGSGVSARLMLDGLPGIRDVPGAPNSATGGTPNTTPHSTAPHSTAPSDITPSSTTSSTAPSTATPAQIVRAGSLAWLHEQGVNIEPAQQAVENANSRGETSIVVAINSLAIGIINISDVLRPEARAAIQDLRNLGISALIASGDSTQVVEAIAADLNIAARGNVLPHHKLQIIKELQGEGKHVAMVGDGVNDAAALAAADLSIALGSGADVAQDAASITIVHSDIRAVPAAINISKRTLRIIKQNLAWAFGYNLIAIPAAVAGVILPGLAAAAMASSSVIVVLNSLRLRSAAR